jgi:hypothetical protein
VCRERIADDEVQRHRLGTPSLRRPRFIMESGVLWHPSEATEKIGPKGMTITSGGTPPANAGGTSTLARR